MFIPVKANIFVKTNMPIPESQLEIWSNQGATVTSKSTADAVKNALNSFEGFPTSDYKVYLQGSYKNDTNIRGESDVDVVIQLNKTFFNNLNEEQDKQLGISSADYLYNDFWQDSVKALQKYFGIQNVKVDTKCIKIKENENRLPADVIITCQYRKYYSVNEYAYTEGVSFYTNDNEKRQIINYPIQVYDKGCDKNKNTSGMFKQVVRLFKNLRRQADIKGPSYFIQCLLYNVPDHLYASTYHESVYNILEYIRTLPDEDLATFVCQHEQFRLFGSSKEQWDIPSARIFNHGIINFWNDYA